MSERITRPTVRLAGGLPDGNLSDLETHSSTLLSGDPLSVYGLVRLTRARLIEDDDNDGAESAVVKVRALESGAVLPAAARPGMTFRELMEIMRAERTGVDQLPLDDDQQQTDAETMRGQLREYATGEGMEDATMGRAWKAYFEGHGLGDPGSWLDADPVHAREFLAAMLEAADYDETDQHEAGDVVPADEHPDAIAVQQSEAEHAA
ncbi:MAG: hypothetical protein H7Y15_08220, partial [Pseudonocardia sp.]|nr:hypothetical protein [Pseudonocardia sp.]